ncbi:MAG: hypothetical protein OEW47_07935 [Thermoleophilia bacterium]|nr:hypothetical protein [Thermoleophilia bacterium]
MNSQPPRFDELVGIDLDAAERDRLMRVHMLLVEAGPPPELEERAPVVELRPRRSRRFAFALAAGLATAAFAAGALVGNRTAGPNVDFTYSMKGTPAASAASASLAVYDLDGGGNWPMEVTVRGLAPSASGNHYELWLTKDGKLAALCGYFRTDANGSAKVPMNAPYKFTDFDGWVVVEEGSRTPLLTT